jgi:general secretion pathway protein D
MTDFRSFLNVSTGLRCGLLALGAALVLPVSSLAQNSPPPPPSEVPDFAPPPNFVPPPSGVPSGNPMRRPVPPAPNADADNGNNRTPPATTSRAGEAYPSIVDPYDPRLNDPVGLIQVPDLGTNDVLSMLEEFTGKPILRQQSLPAVKITFYSQGPMTRGEAIRALESLLALNGIAVTTVGDQFLKAVPAAVINTQSPIFWEGSTLGAPPTQQIYEKLFSLDYLLPSEALPLIQPLLSQGSPIAYEKSGLLMVTDALVNLQRIERILKVIDSPAELKTEILFFELKNSDAQDVVRRLQQIQQGPLSRRLQGNTTFDADQNTNQLLIFTHPSNAQMLTDLVEKMDVDIAPQTATKVYSIRYAEAVEVADIIEQVVTGQKQARDQNNPQRNARQQQNNQAAAAARADAGNLQFSELLTLVPDERANSIVASGTPGDLQALDELIEQIDVLLAQVRIEAVIVEVRLGKDDTSGIDSLSAGYSLTDDGETLLVDPFSIGGLGVGGALLGGSEESGSGIYFGPDGEFSMGLILNAVKINQNAQVLSAPTIVTTHNREAKIAIGEQYPVITGTSSSNLSDYSTSQIQRQNIGIELTVTPLIGSDNVIQLEIEQSINDIAGTTPINGTDQPIVTTREASSFVSVGDGQLVVLGGLQQSSTNHNESRFPILGSIPLLEEIFTRKTDNEVRREIILFLRPRIVRTAKEADALTRQQLQTIENRERIEAYLESGTFKVEEEPEEEDSREVPRRNKP